MWWKSAILRRGSDYDTDDKTVSTHQDRQAFLDFLGQPELLPLLGEDVGGVGTDVGAESAHQAHDQRSGARSCSDWAAAANTGCPTNTGQQRGGDITLTLTLYSNINTERRGTFI